MVSSVALRRRTVEIRGSELRMAGQAGFQTSASITEQMDKTFKLVVNGQDRRVATDPDRSLLDVLREEFQLTGTKYGCGEGQCRACTVLLDGKSVPSCMTSVADADGRQILTIEGLAKGDTLHPVQQAFADEGAFQCGYCTAGMIMGVVGLLGENPHPSEKEILAKMQRHLCRCCSYPRILGAIHRYADLHHQQPESLNKTR